MYGYVESQHSNLVVKKTGQRETAEIIPMMPLETEAGWRIMNNIRIQSLIEMMTVLISQGLPCFSA